MTCSECGASAAGGRIFCLNCGATLETPVPLVASDFPDPPAKIGALRRVAIVLLKGVGGIAAVVFLLSRLTTNTGIFLFGASIVVGFLCIIGLSYLDDNFPDENGRGGYWPKVLVWGKPGSKAGNDKSTDIRPH